jgi:membrane protease YdiL (CAAX protease family)
LLRVLSLTVPLREVPSLYWYAMIGIPLLLAAALAAYALGLSWSDLGLSLSSRSSFSRPFQVAIAATGVPLSLVAFWLVPRPQPIPTTLAGHDIILAPIILFLFTGFAEELIFRGILQQTARQALGPPFSIVYSSVLFATMYVGSLSPGYVTFMGLVGLLFGWCVNRTGSLWGVVLAHSLLNIGMLLIWPVIL